ncbi:MAG: acyl-CoA reductase [Saprospiraceae bacterium]|nr:acyl-CoA reductase [Saprospiraceae bacterium]MBK9679528.1 acyl-CoA reductase [Saprospiraceae bacterium]
MNLTDRIRACAQLGQKLITDLPLQLDLLQKVKNENIWFDQEQVLFAVQNIVDGFLTEDLLSSWIQPYHLKDGQPKRIGIIMAGNLPLVGFHDVLSVFMAGHYSKIKLSHKDSLLWPYVIGLLSQIDVRTGPFFELVEKLNDIDALIATGSDNSARYFHYYFAHHPHIIRNNRVGVAVITGRESDYDLLMLGQDVFQYYGLGCRNVSSLMVPEGYDITRLCKSWDQYAAARDNRAYSNNYDYNMAIYMMNKVPFLVNDAILFVESEEIVSRLAVIHYTYYKDLSEVITRYESNKDKIQVMVCHEPLPGVPILSPGQAQCPSLEDYADQVDTLQFLQRL